MLSSRLFKHCKSNQRISDLVKGTTLGVSFSRTLYDKGRCRARSYCIKCLGYSSLFKTEITAREEMSNHYFEVPNLIDDAGPYSYDQDFLVSEVQ
jgi:hypothetical protein